MHRPSAPDRSTEGGELGYSISHSFGAVIRQPVADRRLRSRRRRSGNGPARDGLALKQVPESIMMVPCCPIPALERYKISNPTLLARISREEWKRCCTATAGRLASSKGTNPRSCTKPWPQRSMRQWNKIKQTQQAARATGQSHAAALAP